MTKILCSKCNYFKPSTDYEIAGNCTNAKSENLNLLMFVTEGCEKGKGENE